MYVCPACHKPMEITACAPSMEDDVYFCDHCSTPLLSTDTGFRRMHASETAGRVMFAGICPELHRHLMVGKWSQIKRLPVTARQLTACPGADSSWGTVGN